MAPFVETWPARELEFRSQVSLKENKRKGFDGGLKGCELLEVLQYKCEVEKPVTKESVTRCWPIERMFRRCVDRNGSFWLRRRLGRERKVDETSGRSFESMKATSIVRNDASCQISSEIIQGRGDWVLHASQEGWDQQMDVMIQVASHYAKAT